MKKDPMPQPVAQPDSSITGNSTMLYLKCSLVLLYGDGVIGVEIPAVQMEEKDRDTLHKLFPNTVEQAYTLLDREKLMTCLLSSPMKPSIKSFSTE
jgi:hypothetical protein